MQRTPPTKKCTTPTPTLKPLPHTPRDEHCSLPPVDTHYPHSVVDEARLLRAIQSLDAAGDTTTTTAAKWRHADVVTRVLRAWAYFLEITIHLNETQDETTRRRVALVLEARVLSCVSRFLRGRARHGATSDYHEDASHHPSWTSWCCSKRMHTASDDGCVRGLIRTAIACFLFQLCRHATTALLVMRSGLHTFLIHECTSWSSTSSASQSSTADYYYDARDVLVGVVDPFEWSTRALSTMFERQGQGCAVFQLPIGARSLSYLLDGQQIPTNEAEECSITLQKTNKKTNKNKNKNEKPHRLPSMFQFPTRVVATTDQVGLQDKPNGDCVVCSPVCDGSVWLVAQRKTTRAHLAVRSVVLLALLLPSSSPERKQFIHDGGVDVLKKWTATSSHTQGNADNDTDNDSDDSSRGAGSQAHVIQAIASAGVRLFEADSAYASKNNDASGKHSVRTTSISHSPASPSSLGEKLHAVTMKNRQNAARQQHQELLKQRDDERRQLRHRVRGLYENATQTRTHLLSSLAILTTGRAHPAVGNQSIVAWLDSFPTIEKKEQQRQEDEALRQRRLLELQYQIDERRRRQREECLLMELQDFDTPDTHAKARNEAKREAFQKIQQEIQSMEQQLEQEHQKLPLTNEELTWKRAAAIDEALRVHKIADQLRREVNENEQMKKEDHYYAIKILREKQLRDHQATLEKQIDPIAEQQKKIERMRLHDHERLQIDQELDEMRAEDLLARQMRFLENQRLKNQVEREWKARRAMEAEERFLRQQWKRIDEALAKQQHEQQRQQRADERRAKREQEQQWKHWQQAWTTSYDAYGNVYYYNQLTGETQWENPLN